MLWLTVCCVHCKVSYTRATPGLLCSLPSTPCLARVNVSPGHRRPSLAHSQADLGHTRPGSFPLHSTWYAGEDECLLKKQTHAQKTIPELPLKECDVPDGHLWHHTGRVAYSYVNVWIHLLYYCRKVIVLVWLTTNLKVLLIKMCLLACSWDCSKALNIPGMD